MDVETITMDPEAAREQLREYRRELHHRADAEYQAIADGLQEIAEGRALLNVKNAIPAGGFDEQARPRLAIARADREQVRFSWNRYGPPSELEFNAHSPNATRESDTLRLMFDVDESPDGIAVEEGWKRQMHNGFALVPIIPARARRESGVTASRDGDHFILWEVDEWSDTRRRSEPDRDPLLLRHLGGDLYVIMAAWDLTELERAVMAGRREA